ncbi:hypothetical protein M2454_000191 [Aequitasia blattaphilus]|uniref:DUF4392 domain-containing protein n=1 Tax=Aequitasia blattaphilus TaxID=2949332 RepID=A0ABT1E565_9FIRM|nr:DUF4392 domain-containing protein [Aequitasia blattaphilus]MCP1100973.1 DUF4392 domain-containing protein [Aequitasia blattaphilus]MCR8613613.1 DUF4392 domain-containing protein [Aequitasia blattaphilus]
MKKESITIEDIVLRHSQRGMNVLRKYMKEDYCKICAGEILNLKKGTIFLTTGFYVAGYAETDGPLGTMVMAEALEKLGFHPVIVTDEYCKGFFECRSIKTLYVDIEAGEKEYWELLEKYQPVGVISIERCGSNIHQDYTNMRGISIKEATAKIDILVELANILKIPTFGIGDGGNEIGMGNLQDAIARELSICPCKVKVEHLVLATVSNWGAYAVVAYFQKITGEKLLPQFEEIAEYLKKIVSIGCVDGVTKERTASVDGFSLHTEKQVIEALHHQIIGCS